MTSSLRNNRLFYSILTQKDKLIDLSNIMPTYEFHKYLHDSYYELVEYLGDDYGLDLRNLKEKSGITLEWLDSIPNNGESYIYESMVYNQCNWKIKVYEHMPVRESTETQLSQSTCGKLRIYQTVMDDVDRQDPLIGVPLAIDAFIPYVLNEYQTALDGQWTDEQVSKSEITREWLESLAVGSATQLIGDEGEDNWLRVHVYEVDTGVSNDTRTVTPAHNRWYQIIEPVYARPPCINKPCTVEEVLMKIQSVDFDEFEDVYVDKTDITREWLEAQPTDTDIEIGNDGEGPYFIRVYDMCVNSVNNSTGNPVSPSGSTGNPVSQPSEIRVRLYQYYVSFGNEVTMSDPLQCDDFLNVVHEAYETDHKWKSDNREVELEEITKEWLESLDVDSENYLYNDCEEDKLVSVMVTEIKVNKN